MSWRSIIISKPSKLSLKNNQLLIVQEESLSLPIEDLAFILIEAREVNITVPLLSALAENGVTLLTCDNEFLPVGQWLPFAKYHRQYKILKLQINISASLKKQLHKKIIKTKISNQAQVLKLCNEFEGAKLLESFKNQVKSGDKDYIEAKAAAKYFQYLFGKNFYRREANAINAHLNYGYIIMRSAIARVLVKSGYTPALGIFHSNEFNAFNLADDLMEVYRPLVDLHTYKKLLNSGLNNELSTQNKQELVALLHNQIELNHKKYTLLSAMDKSIASLQAALINKDANLLILPNILDLGEFYYD